MKNKLIKLIFNRFKKSFKIFHRNGAGVASMTGAAGTGGGLPQVPDPCQVGISFEFVF